MITRDLLIELYWEQGQLLEVIAPQLGYSRSGLHSIMKRLEVPTTYNLINDFCYWEKKLDEGEMRRIFERYLQMRSPAITEHRRWIDITSENRESLRCIERFLADLNVPTRLGNYRSRGSHYLRIQDENLDTLSGVFNLSW